MFGFMSLVISISLLGCVYGQQTPAPPNETEASAAFAPSKSMSTTAHGIKPGAPSEPGSSHNRKYFLHVGPAAVIFSPSAQIRAGEVSVPGAKAEIGNNAAVGVEAGIFLTDSLAVSLTAGVPPRATVRGAGSVAALGVVGSAKYGPAAATVHYHLNRWNVVQPYVGAGLNYTLLMSKQDGGVSGLRLTNGIGPVLQAGSEVRLGRSFGIFVDVKRIFVATTLNGTVAAFGGAPTIGSLRLDPWLIHMGIGYRFGKPVAR